MDLTLTRILELMNKNNITAVQMEEYLGVSKGSFGNWKRGIGKLYYAYIDKIADRLGVTIDYLVRGEDMKSDSLSHTETELIENFRKLSKEGKEIVSANVRLLADR